MTAADASWWLERARAAQAAGDLASAYAHCLEAVRRDPRHARALVALGLALHRSRQSAKAMDAFGRAAQADPNLTEAWGNLAAMMLEAERFPDALEALNRALLLAPVLPDLHALRGDLLRLTGEIPDAVSSYARAVELRPGAPAFLNKLSSAQRLAGDLSSAEVALRRLLAIEPSFGLARVNLGTLCVEQNRLDEGRALLREALATPALDSDARHEAASTLSILDEHERLAPALADAVAREDDVLMREGAAATSTAALDFDAGLLDRLAELLGRTVEADFERGFSKLESLPPDWPAIEAHFALHRGDDIDAVRTSIGRIAAASESDSSIEARDLRRHARAIAIRKSYGVPPDGASCEARVRFWHAMLTCEHPALFPGQLKPTPNLVRKNPLVKRVRPEHVAGTLRRFFDGPYRAVGPGALRAIFVYYTICEIHGFADGNGRLARFLANQELESAGLHPLVLTDSTSLTVLAALSAVRTIEDLEPLRELFLHASAETASVVAALLHEPASRPAAARLH